MFITSDLDEYAHAALRTGASGCLLKGALPDGLLAGIGAVACADAVIAPLLTLRLLGSHAHKLLGPANGRTADDGPRVRPPTERERESSWLSTPVAVA
ncbi:hypothetical protein ACPXCS_37235 [Streptomyces sp. DT190]|uniref:hypothetical protein n=1 Tax=unclassified Streptomyces TaxID=2593676 RepID=UPI003CF138B1